MNRSVEIVYDHCITNSILFADLLTNGNQNSILRYSTDDDQTFATYIDQYSSFNNLIPAGDCDKLDDYSSLYKIIGIDSNEHDYGLLTFD